MSGADKQWGVRLKQARIAAQLSQKQLGIRAGIDEFVASTRINRYELGVHKPDYLTAQNLARVLGLSAAFFYAPEDDVASLLFKYCQSSKAERAAVQKILERLPGPPSSNPGVSDEVNGERVATARRQPKASKS